MSTRRGGRFEWTCHYGLQPWVAGLTACGYRFKARERYKTAPKRPGRSEVLEHVNCGACRRTVVYRAALAKEALERCA